MENLGKKMLGMGTSLTKKKSGAEQADWKISSLTSIGEIKLEVGEIDVTTLDSTDGAKEFISGDVTVSDLPLTGKIKTKNDEANIEKMQTKEATTEGIIEFEASLKFSGKPTYTKSV